MAAAASELPNYSLFSSHRKSGAGVAIPTYPGRGGYPLQETTPTKDSLIWLILLLSYSITLC